MNLEDQVTSLELSKRLKELGIKQESYFQWATDIGKNFFVYNEESYPIYADYPKPTIICSAFTASELGEILPNRITTKENDPFNSFVIVIQKFISVDQKSVFHNNYIINYECDSTSTVGADAWLARRLTNNIFDPNLANGMAKMLIFLIENNLYKIEY